MDDEFLNILGFLYMVIIGILSIFLNTNIYYSLLFITLTFLISFIFLNKLKEKYIIILIYLISITLILIFRQSIISIKDKNRYLYNGFTIIPCYLLTIIATSFLQKIKK